MCGSPTDFQEKNIITVGIRLFYEVAQVEYHMFSDSKIVDTAHPPPAHLILSLRGVRKVRCERSSNILGSTFGPSVVVVCVVNVT